MELQKHKELHRTKPVLVQAEEALQTQLSSVAKAQDILEGAPVQDMELKHLTMLKVKLVEMGGLLVVVVHTHQLVVVQQLPLLIREYPIQHKELVTELQPQLVLMVLVAVQVLKVVAVVMRVEQMAVAQPKLLDKSATTDQMLMLMLEVIIIQGMMITVQEVEA